MYYWVTVSFILVSIPVRIVAQDTVIHVGSDGQGTAKLAFTPSSVNLIKGSVVTFVFDGAPGNHTVAQSAFAKPCEPLAGGFDTGYIFVPAGTDASSTFPTFNITIEDDTKPIWFYCAQLNPAPHCIAEMVGAINAPATGNTFSSYAALAAAASSVAPPAPALSGVNAFATAGPGPLTGSFVGVAVPTGTLSVPGGSSGAASSSTPRLTQSFTSSAGGSSPASGTSPTVRTARVIAHAL
ncbi:uncharacterized protein TRAVEDRAFT_144728 [Trametes versicolor FP-101664 SS1]|uniref:uncharacterized protein n=1 Tax=Trametes versicolor (strain FP-101664) TaxID=717944 RepID=UPI0004621E6C|nr:uncharacterized protein TRAVEDRAFT_144728 [Trametes versicolor FP-101664 SS1]EIW62263.1 hypothetical protein TRAVEDRAFT_144728 [Trametes versicolor FP-101664 SS1]